jgi:signal transduction histidine kinase
MFARRPRAYDAREPMSDPTGPRDADPLTHSKGIWILAHDLKNSFGMMEDAIEDLRRSAVTGEGPQRAVSELRALLAHVDHLVSTLLDGLRSQSLDRTGISINDFLEERGADLRAMLTPGVSMTIRVSMTTGVVLATLPELERLVNALIANACAAMPDGGHLTITTGWLDHVAGGPHPSVRPRRYIRLTVADTRDSADRGAHSGLLEAIPPDPQGLERGRETIVSAVRRLGGWLIVESEEQGGACVHVCVPAIAEQADS